MITSSNVNAAPASNDQALADGIAANGDSTANLFTTLLVAQIRNQNPLEPTDPSQFVAQLTQLSQMEALNKLAAQGVAQGTMLQGLRASSLGAQIGSYVSVTSDQVRLAGDPVTGSFTLESASSKTMLVLTGADGVQHPVALGTRAPGLVGFTLDAAELGLAPGAYTMSLQADGKQTPPISVAGRLDGVRFSGSGGVLLDVSSAGEVPADALAGFGGRPLASSTSPASSLAH